MKSSCLLLSLALCACQSRKAHPTDKWATLSIGWNELVSDVGTRFKPAPQFWLEDAVVTPARLAKLPPFVRHDPFLAKLIIERFMTNLRRFDQGIVGDVGNAQFFVARSQLIPNYRRLYWTIVRLMSKKFGCFMVGKKEVGSLLQFKCRDRRQIGFWRSRGRGYIQFYARQFDREGYEIVVRKRRLVRISDRAIIDTF